MDFAWAMEAMLAGHRLRRVDWNRPAYVEVREVDGMRFVAMVMKDGRVGPYTPSHCDMLSRDWTEAC